MSICANIYCLFRQPPSVERLSELQAAIFERVGVHLESRRSEVLASDYGHLVQTWDADTEYQFDRDGTVTRLDRPRSESLYGEPSREGRFFGIHYLTRWWSESIPEGPLAEYVVTLLTLLRQDDVEAVWYAPDQWDSMRAVTSDDAHALLDAFISTGCR